MARKYKGLGVGGFCLPEKSMADPVTHAELQRELRRLRTAIATIADRSRDLGSSDYATIHNCLREPGEREGEGGQ